MVFDRAGDVIPEIAGVAFARGLELDDHGKGSPVRDEMTTAFAEVLFQRQRLEGRGHDHDLEVGTPLALHVEAAGEANVTEEMAFVKLVEDDRCDIG